MNVTGKHTPLKTKGIRNNNCSLWITNELLRNFFLKKEGFIHKGSPDLETIQDANNKVNNSIKKAKYKCFQS